ncbi:MAG: hypothetical protein WC470_01105 [Candidatus Paceibacterota bacterium]
MEYKKAISILLKIMERDSLTAEEKEAIQIAIGTLDCGSLAENRFRGILKGMKAKKGKDLE